MDRRRLLLGTAGTATLAWLGACSSSGDPKESGVETLTYGDDPSQRVELTRPDGEPKGVVVVVHGGFWRSQYDLSLGRPLAKDLAAHGWLAANIEYRRVGDGGGWPTTGDDVARAIDAVGAAPDVDASTLITLGHSAGGHLGTWVVGRTQETAVTGVVSQAGVLDLSAARSEGLGGGAVDALLGSSGDLRDADPMSRVPLSVPVRCIHGRSDTNVPLSQSKSYVAAATEAGADATLTEVDGDHFVLIDVRSDVWRRTRTLLADLAG